LACNTLLLLIFCILDALNVATWLLHGCHYDDTAAASLIPSLYKHGECTTFLLVSFNLQRATGMDDQAFRSSIQSNNQLHAIHCQCA
jgi:hypothetical protein